MPRVLFICTHNSARSQMAEGLLRNVAGDRFYVESAGTEETRVRPLAIRGKEEIGIDISAHTSKTFARFLGEEWDYVISVLRFRERVLPGISRRSHPPPLSRALVQPILSANATWMKQSNRGSRRWIATEF